MIIITCTEHQTLDPVELFFTVFADAQQELERFVELLQRFHRLRLHVYGLRLLVQQLANTLL